MSIKFFIGRFILACIQLFLLMIAWWAIAGGLRQFPLSNTLGQQVETIIQLACGLLCLLTILTTFWWRKWAKIVRVAWVISLVSTAALSSLIWGPPMPLLAMAFAAVALIISMIILWFLNQLSINTFKTID